MEALILKPKFHFYTNGHFSAPREKHRDKVEQSSAANVSSFHVLAEKGREGLKGDSKTGMPLIKTEPWLLMTQSIKLKVGKD